MRTDSADPLTDVLAISPFQEGIWLFWRLNPDSPAYAMPEVFHFDGDFDVEAAEFAFNEVIRRHEALRTTFRETGDGVVQVIERDPRPVAVDVVDLRELPADAQPGRLRVALDAAANRPFDLSAGPAIRLTAIRVSESRTSLVMVAHHIVCDGTSMTIIFDEFGELYRAARQGTRASLEPAPGYSVFVREQLATLADGGRTEDLAYWRERLAGVTGSALPGTEHSAARLPEALDTYTLSTTLRDELAGAVSAYARRARATPFTVMLSAMNVMIALAAGDGDVAIGTATSGRTPKFARTVGMLTNMVISRSRIDVDRTFGAVLEDVSLDLMDAIDHQDLPFSQVIAGLREAGLESGASLARTGFSAGAVGRLNFGEGKLSETVAHTAEGSFDLAAFCDITPAGIAIDWEYAQRAYSREIADGYCAAYQEILAALVGQPDAPVNSLGLAEILARVVPARDSGAPVPGTSGAAAGSTAASAGAGHDSALTPVEEAVAAIWSAVIGVPVGSPEDDFFELGGHSTLASRIIAQVRTEVSPGASLRLLFEHPQLRDFSSRLAT